VGGKLQTTCFYNRAPEGIFRPSVEEKKKEAKSEEEETEQSVV
jgi:hypothetical protein